MHNLVIFFIISYIFSPYKFLTMFLIANLSTIYTFYIFKALPSKWKNLIFLYSCSSYHSKITQSLHNCSLLLLRTPWLLALIRLRQIEILSNLNTTFPLHLRYIKATHLHPLIMLSNIFLNFLICSLLSAEVISISSISTVTFT